MRRRITAKSNADDGTHTARFECGHTAWRSGPVDLRETHANCRDCADMAAGMEPPKASPEAEEVPRSPPSRAPGQNPCLCGCGALVGRFFAPGHDAKVKSLLRKGLPVSDEALTYARRCWGF